MDTLTNESSLIRESNAVLPFSSPVAPSDQTAANKNVPYSVIVDHMICLVGGAHHNPCLHLLWRTLFVFGLIY